MFLRIIEERKCKKEIEKWRKVEYQERKKLKIRKNMEEAKENETEKWIL